MKTTYVPFKGTGDMVDARARRPRRRRDVVHRVRDQQQGQGARARSGDGQAPSAAARCADLRELGVDWIDGAYRGIGMPKSTPPDARKRMSDLWASLNNDAEMKELAAKSGFELINVGVDQMDAFMRERVRIYTDVPRPKCWVLFTNRTL